MDNIFKIKEQQFKQTLLKPEDPIHNEKINQYFQSHDESHIEADMQASKQKFLENEQTLNLTKDVYFSQRTNEIENNKNLSAPQKCSEKSKLKKESKIDKKRLKESQQISEKIAILQQEVTINNKLGELSLTEENLRAVQIRELSGQNKSTDFLKVLKERDVLLSLRNGTSIDNSDPTLMSEKNNEMIRNACSANKADNIAYIMDLCTRVSCISTEDVMFKTTNDAIKKYVQASNINSFSNAIAPILNSIPRDILSVMSDEQRLQLNEAKQKTSYLQDMGKGVPLYVQSKADTLSHAASEELQDFSKRQVDNGLDLGVIEGTSTIISYVDPSINELRLHEELSHLKVGITSFEEYKMQQAKLRVQKTQEDFIDDYKKIISNTLSLPDTYLPNGSTASHKETETQRTYDFRTAKTFLKDEYPTMSLNQLDATKKWNAEYVAGYTSKDASVRFKTLDSLITEKFLSVNLSPEMITEEYYIQNHMKLTKFFTNSTNIENLIADNVDYFDANPQILTQLKELDSATALLTSIATAYDMKYGLKGNCATSLNPDSEQMKLKPLDDPDIENPLSNPEYVGSLIQQQIELINKYNKLYGQK